MCRWSSDSPARAKRSKNRRAAIRESGREATRWRNKHGRLLRERVKYDSDLDDIHRLGHGAQGPSGPTTAATAAGKNHRQRDGTVRVPNLIGRRALRLTLLFRACG